LQDRFARPRAIARTRWRRMTATVVLVFGVALLGMRPTVRALLRGEMDLEGRRVFVPPHGPTPAELAEVDLELVHAELLPVWLAEVEDARRGLDADEAGAFAALLAEAGRDPNLAGILVELRALVLHDLDTEAGRALYLLWAWEDYVGHFGHPWAVEAGVSRVRGRPSLQLATYSVHGVLEAKVGIGAHEIRLVERADAGELREAYLGATRRADDHARVVIDRVADFAVEEIWPLLDASDDASLSLAEQAWAPSLRLEAASALAVSDLDVLVATAPAQRRIRAVVNTVRERRECARRRLLQRVPWAGFGEAELSRLQAVAAIEVDRACPSITPLELSELAEASRQLREHEDLRAPVGALVAWTTQHVAIHEARHLADRAEVGGLDEPIECRSCGPEMSSDARAELSGQLAAIAWSGSPATAMYQACLLVHRDPEAPHAQAMDLLTTRLRRPCGSGPPADLDRLARELEGEMLGRSDPIALPIGFPRRLEM
jgi:hypothetical protein